MFQFFSAENVAVSYILDRLHAVNAEITFDSISSHKEHFIKYYLQNNNQVLASALLIGGDPWWVS